MVHLNAKKKDAIFKNSYFQVNVVTSENAPKVICMKIQRKRISK